MGLVVAGGGFALALRRGAQPTAPPSAPSRPAAKPGAAERLTPHRDERAFAVPALGLRDPSDGQHTVAVDAAGTLGPDAGVAAFSPVTGGRMLWTPLADGASGPDGARRLGLRLPPYATSLALALSRDDARHRYLLRVELPPLAAREATTRFALTVTPTRFAVGDGGDAGPVQVVRVGDPEWQPPASAAAGLRFPGGAAELLLGPGEYELVDPIDPGIRQRFAVPSPSPIEVTSRLLRPRDGRL